MKMVIIGYGWVGQANALALSLMGYEVFFYDIKPATLHYADKYSQVYPKIKKIDDPTQLDGEDTYYLICVGDRTLENGEQDISAIKMALEPLSHVKGPVILRSTVLPDNLKQLKFDFYLPEFLHEKKAVEECLKPHFFVVGEYKPGSKWPDFFKRWSKLAHKTFRGTPEEASYIKYLSNIWNAVQIAFVNEFGDSIKKPDSQEEVNSIQNIIDFVLGGGAYVRYGKAFSGHCLPKDTASFSHWKEKNGFRPALIAGAYASNLAHEEFQNKTAILPEWYSEWQLPEISLVTSLKIIARIFRRKFFGR